ncbi:hypothetical protein E3P81_03297 [Wallemia ichthyophaga]|uniref:Fe2OG dioxygenase domain-containing protein n=1 Tax=Wallemia ichthyophaga TaxID=245174 RepID=A0A4T0GJ18_WALIC|nr:hypothetical protein E3P96_02525 [Wallemia ichthyophaga]TIB37654.1 hypothetical protein E3P86_02080 [Wallemia ichthyophaga]TIB47371.1 hypothetical protein E3P81_03297 [Wallemia ichthyophaga]
MSKSIPWPTYEKTQRKDYTNKETPEDVLNRVTYTPSPPTKANSRTAYNYILGKKDAGPIEVAIAHELANPHSKHKRAHRYAQKQRKWAYRLEELEKTEKVSGVWNSAAKAQNEARRLWLIERALAKSEQYMVDTQGTPAKRENKRIVREAKKTAKEARRTALLNNLVLNKDGKIFSYRIGYDNGFLLTVMSKKRDGDDSGDDEITITNKKPKNELIIEEISDSGFLAEHRIDGMDGGDMQYKADLFPVEEADELYAQVLNLERYRPTLKIFGKDVIQSRQVAVFAIERERAQMKYSNHDAKVDYPFPAVINRIAKRLREVCGVDFTHCMVNYYADGDTYIGKHSDNLNNQVIATVSLGAVRTMHLSPQTTKAALKVYPHVDVPGRQKLALKLAHGSLFVMQGETQRFWKHEIRKEQKIKTGRISLTFRQIVD